MLVKRIKCHIRNTDSSSTGFCKVGPRGNSDFSFFFLFLFSCITHGRRRKGRRKKKAMNTQSWSEEGRSSCLFPKRTHTCDKLVLRFADAFCTVLKTFTGMFLPNKIFWGKWELFFSCGEFLPPPNEARKSKK